MLLFLVLLIIMILLGIMFIIRHRPRSIQGGSGTPTK